jgi:hypothetical protein
LTADIGARNSIAVPPHENLNPIEQAIYESNLEHAMCESMETLATAAQPNQAATAAAQGVAPVQGVAEQVAIEAVEHDIDLSEWVSTRGEHGYKGVSRLGTGSGGGYTARSLGSTNRLNLGTFDTDEEAAMAVARHELSTPMTGPMPAAEASAQPNQAVAAPAAKGVPPVQGATEQVHGT